jgi:hypothetical protein
MPVPPACWRLSGTARPLALLIGHDAESRSILNTLLKSLEDELGDMESERRALHRYFDGFGERLAEISSADERLKWLKNHAPAMIRHLFYDAGPAAELLRYSRLIRDRRTQRLGSLTNSPGYLSEDFQDTEAIRKDFAVPITQSELAEESRLKVDWEDRLWEEKRTKKVLAIRADLLIGVGVPTPIGRPSY